MSILAQDFVKAFVISCHLTAVTLNPTRCRDKKCVRHLNRALSNIVSSFSALLNITEMPACTHDQFFQKSRHLTWGV